MDSQVTIGDGHFGGVTSCNGTANAITTPNSGITCVSCRNLLEIIQGLRLRIEKLEENNGKCTACQDCAKETSECPHGVRGVCVLCEQEYQEELDRENPEGTSDEEINEP
jgi:hypothetical protein